MVKAGFPALGGGGSRTAPTETLRDIPFASAHSLSHRFLSIYCGRWITRWRGSSRTALPTPSCGASDEGGSRAAPTKGTMPYDSEIHHRRSIRLRGYDYSQLGGYFVTICTEGKEHLFGQVVEGEMHRNEWGDSVARCWKWLAQRYSKVVLDEWIVMPNHLHGIIVITNGRGGSRTALPTPSCGASDEYFLLPQNESRRSAE